MKKKEIINYNLGNEIKAYRIKLGMTQSELAEGICNPSYITHIEKGYRSPNAFLLFQIAEKLKVPVSLLVSPYSYELIGMLSDLTKSSTIEMNYSKIKEYLRFIEDNYELYLDNDIKMVNGIRIFIKAVESDDFSSALKSLTAMVDEIPHKETYISPSEFAFETGLYYLHFLSGNIEFAYKHLTRLYYRLHTVRAFEHHEMVTKFFIQIALVCNERGNYDRSLIYLEEGIDHCKSKGTQYLIPELVYHKGEATFLKGRVSEGLTLIKDAILMAGYIYIKKKDFMDYIEPRLKKFDIKLN